MTTQPGSQAIGLTRCAVCKIDLKGRLVYVDDQIEQLLGRTREDLFGKPLHDFVDRASQELISSLLERRNHYETFYDATRVTLIHSEGQFACAMAVVSLNFNGGNPVNFQLVLNPIEREEFSIAQPITTFDSKQFAADLIEVCSFSRWKDFLRTLCRLEGVAQAAVYLIRDGRLEPRSAASDDSSADFAYKAISATGKLHEEVAQTGNEYSLLDQEMVQAAIERHGVAPDEFVARVEFSENQIYLLRLVFAENMDRVRISEALDNTRFALDMMHKIVSLQDISEPDESPAFDIRFTIGFLEALSVAAFATDHEGRIVGYNSTALEQFDESLLQGYYAAVYEHLQAKNKADLADSVTRFLTGEESDEAVDELRLEIALNDREEVRLTIIRLGDTADDKTSCHVFVPYLTLADGQASEAKEIKPKGKHS